MANPPLSVKYKFKFLYESIKATSFKRHYSDIVKLIISKIFPIITKRAGIISLIITPLYLFREAALIDVSVVYLNSRHLTLYQQL